MSLLKVQNIQCSYDTTEVLSDLNFSLEAGRIACLLGPSGCGKTTALRAIAGFEPVLAGAITLDGQILSAKGTMVPPELRGIGMVFQDYALFPHLTVRANVGFALNKSNANERNSRVDNLLALVQLQEYADAWPHQLSGGQQQRVALARALAPSPRLLLLDEPFSNLDTELRRSLSLEVRNILKECGITAILVTHDRTEAFNMADEIGVMQKGRLAQWDTPDTLYRSPANAYVAGFICDGRFLSAVINSKGNPETLLGELVADDTGTPTGTQCRLLVRPDEVKMAETPNKQNTHFTESVSATVISRQFAGPVTLTTLQLADGTLLDSSDIQLAGHQQGDSTKICLQSPQPLFFPE